MAEIIEETWFIAVMAVVGAIILILVMVIVILCYMWNRKKKDDEESHSSNTSNNNTGKTPSSDNSKNWLLVHPSDKVSAPASSDNTRAHVIRGNEPVVAGSSLIHIDKEMRNGNYTHSNMPTSLEKNKYIDAFDHDRDLGYGSDTRSSSRISRTEESRESRKPRIANVSVSSLKKNESQMVYYTDKNTVAGNPQGRKFSVEGSPQVVNATYRVPQADYDFSSSIVMYSSEEHSSWQTSNDHTQNTKVKGLASAFENPKEIIPVSSPTRAAVENELKELQHNAPIKKRLSQRGSGNSAVQKKTSNILDEIPDDEDDLKYREEHPDAWKRMTGKSTIENRLKRFKKAGAMSVFPD